MKVNEVKKQIQAKSLDSFFVFTGEEIEAQRIYINKIAEVTGKTVKRIDKVSEAFNKRSSLFKTSSVYVARDDVEFWKSGVPLDKVGELLGDNMLILQMTSIDGRSKSSKEYAQQIVEFSYMDDDVLYKYTYKACQLSEANVYDLMDMCEHDYSRVLLESDKINRYASAKGVTADEAFTQLVKEKAITRPPNDAIFDFVDAMLKARIDRAFGLLEECKAVGESSVRILSVLYNNFKRVLQYQVSTSRDVCAETGLTPFDVKLAKESAGTWKSEDIVYFLETIQRIEQGIKTGEIEETSALDILMVSIL